MESFSSLKTLLQEEIFNAYDYGIRLPDGCVAFYDQQQGCFIDGNILKPLVGDQERDAIDIYDSLTDDEQEKNKSYWSLCSLYRNLAKREADETASAFNVAATSRPASEAEPVGQIVRRIFSSLLAPKF